MPTGFAAPTGSDGPRLPARQGQQAPTPGAATLTVRVPGRYPSANQWDFHLHWAARAKKAKKWRGDTRLMTELAIRTHPTPWPPATWATLLVRHHVRAARRRDLGNYASVKHAIDGLVDGGALVDDNSEVLKSSTVEFVRDGREELELIVTRLDGAV